MQLIRVVSMTSFPSQEKPGGRPSDSTTNLAPYRHRSPQPAEQSASHRPWLSAQGAPPQHTSPPQQTPAPPIASFSLPSARPRLELGTFLLAEALPGDVEAPVWRAALTVESSTRGTAQSRLCRRQRRRSSGR